MSFASNINYICAIRGTNLTSVVKEVKGSSSFATAINKGSLPKETEIIEMAKILNCSVIDFFIDDEELATLGLPNDEDEGDILRVYRSLPRREKHEFMTVVYGFDSHENITDDKEASIV